MISLWSSRCGSLSLSAVFASIMLIFTETILFVPRLYYVYYHRSDNYLRRLTRLSAFRYMCTYINKRGFLDAKRIHIICTLLLYSTRDTPVLFSRSDKFIFLVLSLRPPLSSSLEISLSLSLFRVPLVVGEVECKTFIVSGACKLPTRRYTGIPGLWMASSFVRSFVRSSDMRACALQLQRTSGGF